MVEAMKSVIDELDLTESEKEHVKNNFNKIHEAFESLKNKNKDSDSKEKEKNDKERPCKIFCVNG